MSNSTEDEKVSSNQENNRPIEEWTEEELKSALTRVYKKVPSDWTSDDMGVIYEENRRKREETIEAFNVLKAKPEFNNEEWIKFLAETAVDIYIVLKRLEYSSIMDSRNLHIVNKNVLSTPFPPIPPSYPPMGPNTSGLERKLDQIIRDLNSDHDWS